MQWPRKHTPEGDEEGGPIESGHPDEVDAGRPIAPFAHPPGCDAADELGDGHSEFIDPVPARDGDGRPFTGPDEPPEKVMEDWSAAGRRVKDKSTAEAHEVMENWTYGKEPPDARRD
jgi:hypothetical protein